MKNTPRKSDVFLIYAFDFIGKSISLFLECDERRAESYADNAE